MAMIAAASFTIAPIVNAGRGRPADGKAKAAAAAGVSAQRFSHALVVKEHAPTSTSAQRGFLSAFGRHVKSGSLGRRCRSAARRHRPTRRSRQPLWKLGGGIANGGIDLRLRQPFSSAEIGTFEMR